MASMDEKGAAHDLKKHGLHVVVLAQTPMEHSSIIQVAHDQNDPKQNKLLADALKIYGKHYLASQDGIPGEGEEIDVILSRLRGEDPNVRAMTVYGLVDDQGHVHGVSFIETYHVKEDGKDGKKLEGLTHLMTYAASEAPYDQYAQNAAFHAGIVHELQTTDQAIRDTDQIGGNPKDDSILATEVNAPVDYNGKRTSTKMDGEFEIKTGAARGMREAYVLGGGAVDTTLMSGHHNHAHILQIPYTPPALAGEGSQSLAHITNAGELADHLKNKEVFEGEGEPLFLTAETLGGGEFTAKHVALHKAFQEMMGRSVALDLGVTDTKLVDAARQHMKAGFKSMHAGYDQLALNIAQGHGFAREIGDKTPA